ncbi:MAG: hypothetical protein MPJ78_19775, partial [Hyphomicrobiaceae bacterium]|nr:hypothetical protein [Hyphomicrobiaceae bacterium]
MAALMADPEAGGDDPRIDTDWIAYWEAGGDDPRIDADWIAAVIAVRGSENGFTANQATRNVYNAEITEECMRLYEELVETGDCLRHGPLIYIVALTTHQGTDVDGEVEDGYREAAWLTRQPLLGYWRPKDEGFLDAAVAVQVIREADAIDLGRDLGQEGI